LSGAGRGPISSSGHIVGAAQTEREPRAEARREEILEGALRVFSDVGYARATTKAIAQAAGVRSPGLIYWYFSNKEDLLREVFLRYAIVLEAAAGPTPCPRRTARARVTAGRARRAGLLRQRPRAPRLPSMDGGMAASRAARHQFGEERAGTERLHRNAALPRAASRAGDLAGARHVGRGADLRRPHVEPDRSAPPFSFHLPPPRSATRNTSTAPWHCSSTA
jgi:AcrR family transcriptional regulator